MDKKNTITMHKIIAKQNWELNQKNPLLIISVELIYSICDFLNNKAMRNFSIICKDIHDACFALKNKRYIEYKKYQSRGLHALVGERCVKGIQWLLEENLYLLNILILDEIIRIGDKEIISLIQRMYTIKKYKLGDEEDESGPSRYKEQFITMMNGKWVWTRDWTRETEINNCLINRVINYDRIYSNSKLPPVCLVKGEYKADRWNRSNIHKNDNDDIYKQMYDIIKEEWQIIISGTTLLFSFEEHHLNLLYADTVILDNNTSLYNITFSYYNINLKGNNIIKKCCMFSPVTTTHMSRFNTPKISIEGSNTIFVSNIMKEGIYESVDLNRVRGDNFNRNQMNINESIPTTPQFNNNYISDPIVKAMKVVILGASSYVPRILNFEFSGECNINNESEKRIIKLDKKLMHKVEYKPQLFRNQTRGYVTKKYGRHNYLRR